MLVLSSFLGIVLSYSVLQGVWVEVKGGAGGYDLQVKKNKSFALYFVGGYHCVKLRKTGQEHKSLAAKRKCQEAVELNPTIYSTPAAPLPDRAQAGPHLPTASLLSLPRLSVHHGPPPLILLWRALTSKRSVPMQSAD